MPKLFISHASEDKAAFVDPLVNKLEEAGIQVWYDKNEITLGDGLLGRIDDGLRKCDFGLVVLSPVYFTKEWTQRELGALLAKEVQNRKVILPVLLGMTWDDVLKRSPILAGRWAISGDRDFDAVVEAIRAALGLSEHTRQVLSVGEGRLALEGAVGRLIAKNEEIRRMNANDARAKVMAANDQVIAAVRQTVQDINNSLGKEIFKVKPAVFGAIYVDGPSGLFVHLDISEMPINCAEGAELTVRYCKANRDQYGAFLRPTTYEEINFHPRMVDAHAVHWAAAEGELMTAPQLSDYTFKKFAHYIDSESA